MQKRHIQSLCSAASSQVKTKNHAHHTERTHARGCSTDIWTHVLKKPAISEFLNKKNFFFLLFEATFTT